ncbi:CHAT domain-containing protein [Kitasatospora sp. NPDC048298]|uniref:CHAT domain-containing protein n=1 Tax=Kitasatospora sp. NPDC048298 TaxID=3364049 RepID=UPI0037183D26
MTEPSVGNVLDQLGQQIADGTNGPALEALREAVYLVRVSRMTVSPPEAYSFLRYAIDLAAWQEVVFWSRHVINSAYSPEAWVVAASVLPGALSHTGGYGAALAEIDTMPDPPTGADPFFYFQLYLNQSHVLNRAKRWSDAIDRIARAEAYMSDHIDLNARCTLVINKGAILDSLGRTEEAMEAYDSILPIVPSGHMAAMLLTNKANLLRALGRHQEADETYEAAYSATSDSDLALRGSILSNAAKLLLETGQRDRGIDTLKRAAELRGAGGDMVGQATSLALLANAYSEDADFYVALEYAEQALALYRAAGLADQGQGQVERLRRAIANAKARPDLAGHILGMHLLNASSFSERVDDLNRATPEVLFHAVVAVEREYLQTTDRYRMAKCTVTRQFLTRVQQVGAQLAIAESEQARETMTAFIRAVAAFATLDSWIKRKRFFSLHRELFEEVFAQGVPVFRDIEGIEESRAAAQTLGELTAAVQRDGLDTAFARLPESAPGELVQRLVEVGTWSETRGLIKHHGEAYLSDATLRYIDDMTQRVLPFQRADIERHARLLRRCAAVGIEAAFGEVLGESRGMDTKNRVSGGPFEQPVPDAGIPEDLVGFDIARRNAKLRGDLPIFGRFSLRLGQQILIRATDSRSMRKAQGVLREALEVLSPGDTDSYYSCLISLGEGHRSLYDVEGDPEDLQEAARYFMKVLEQTRSKAMPYRTRQASVRLYNALNRLRTAHADTWTEVVRKDREAMLLQACRRMMELTDEDLRLLRVDEEFWWPFAEAVLIEYGHHHYGAALLTADRGRGRRFLTEVGSRCPLPDYVPDDLARREAEARSRLKVLYAAEELDARGISEAGGESAEFNWALSRAQADLGRVLDELAVDFPELARIRGGAALTPSDLNEFTNGLGSGTVVLAWYTTPERCISFLLRSGTSEILAADAAIGWNRLASYVELAAADLWLKPASPEQSLAASWSGLMDALVPPAWADHLAHARELVLLPHGLLHELPLHALPLAAAGGRTLTDIGVVRHLPGLTFAGPMRRQQRLARSAAGTASSVFAFSRGSDPHFSAEATTIAATLGTGAHLDGDATCERVIDVAPGARILHLAAHGWFDADDPLESGIHLFDGVLTARDVIERIRLNGTTVVLSGCETNRISVSPVDESEGLVRAFLIAGASTVIASQWAVDSASTRTLMEQAYRRSGERGMATALRDSMLEHRTQYPHPYYWAPFIYWGADPAHE